MSTRTIDGLTPSQFAWMQSDYTAAKALGKTHTFIFTHGPIVGHGGGATHDSWDIMIGPDGELIPVWVDHDVAFVEWVNGAGMTVEAVFCGHTHLNRFYHSVDIENMNDPYCYYTKPLPGESIISPKTKITYSYSNHVAYIETDTACKGY